MHLLDKVLLVTTSATLIAWIALSSYVLSIDRQRRRARANLKAIAEILCRPDVRRLAVEDRVAGVRPLLARASRDMLVRAAAESAGSDDVFLPLSMYLNERWGVGLPM